MPKDHGIIGLNDSKKLSPKKRLVLYKEIKIHTNRDGQISSISNQFADPYIFNISPSISAQTSLAIAKPLVSNRTYLKDDQLAVYVEKDRSYLVYKLDLAGFPISKTFLIDAHTGSIVNEIMQTVDDGPAVGQGMTNLGTFVDELQIYEGNGFVGSDPVSYTHLRAHET